MPPSKQADEPVPSFRGKVTVAGVVLTLLQYVVLFGLPFVVESDHLRAAQACAVMVGPSLVVGAILLLLERPARDWMARRYARRVERGILDLERKAQSPPGIR